MANKIYLGKRVQCSAYQIEFPFIADTLQYLNLDQVANRQSPPAEQAVQQFNLRCRRATEVVDPNT